MKDWNEAYEDYNKTHPDWNKTYEGWKKAKERFCKVDGDFLSTVTSNDIEKIIAMVPDTKWNGKEFSRKTKKQLGYT